MKTRARVKLTLSVEVKTSCSIEGIKHAINNDIRVKLQPDSTWIWTKSPWDDGELPTQKPIDALNLR